MQTTPSRARPSDNPAFNANQSAQEQLYILADMLYIYKPFWGVEGGPLVDYREVVKSGADTIPGRTRGESLDMINRAIDFVTSAGAVQEAEAQRVRLRNMLAISFVLIAVVGIGWMVSYLHQIVSL